MKQLTCTAPGRVAWTDAAEPDLTTPQSALIRPLVVARCEADPLLITAGPTAAGSFAVGHEAIAEVITVGAAVHDLAPGDVVACAFQLCCGQCRSCGRGRTALCDRYPILSDYGMRPLSGVEYGGMLSDVVHVPHATAMLAPFPAGLDLAAHASVADNIADGYHAVAGHLAEEPGADVLIVCHGLRSIALYAALAALDLGAGSVTLESDDTDVLAAAAAIGADAVVSDFGPRANRWPIVIDCGVRTEGLLHAIASTEPEGVLHSVSYYGAPRTAIPLGKLYTRGIRFFTGRVHSAAAMREVLEKIQQGALDLSAIRPTVIPWADAPTRYLDDAIKLVVVRNM